MIANITRRPLIDSKSYILLFKSAFMGIHKINQFLSEHASDAFCDKSIEYFKKQRIAIDAGIFMHKNMAKALHIVTNRTDFATQILDREDVLKVWIEVSLKS